MCVYVCVKKPLYMCICLSVCLMNFLFFRKDFKSLPPQHPSLQRGSSGCRKEQNAFQPPTPSSQLRTSCFRRKKVTSVLGQLLSRQEPFLIGKRETSSVVNHSILVFDKWTLCNFETLSQNLYFISSLFFSRRNRTFSSYLNAEMSTEKIKEEKQFG